MTLTLGADWPGHATRLLTLVTEIVWKLCLLNVAQLLPVFAPDLVDHENEIRANHADTAH